MTTELAACLRAGADSRAGRKSRNEDTVAIAAPNPAEWLARGALFAIADGVSGSDCGDRASQYAVRGVLNDFYATPETWATPVALDRVISAQNRWLRSQREGGSHNLVTTLSLLVLCGARYCIAHAGDTRIYRLRDGRFDCLTTDHVWQQPGMSHVLTRALGLDHSVAIDFCEGDWQAGDIFLLVCDGVWAHVPESDMMRTLNLFAGDLQNSNPEHCARQLCEQALANGSDDNVSALVVQCLQTPPDNMRERIAAGRQLPVPAKLKPGSVLDGFVVDELLHASRESLVYRVHDEADRSSAPQAWVLKTLTPLAADDVLRRNALHMEEWLAARMPSRHFVGMFPFAADRRQHLYIVQKFHAGATLARRHKQGQRFSVAEIVPIAEQLLQAMAALHRMQVIHRDIKPENLHLGSDNVLRVLDLGVAWCGSLDETETHNPGTPSYMAPELFACARSTVQTDLYAVGVTLYFLLSGHYPYGEVEPFQTPRFGDPKPVTRYRHDVPLWLDDVLLKAVARDPAQRFETAEEMLLALQRGESHGLVVRRQSPLVQRNPLGLWRALALGSLLLNLFLLYLLLVS